MMLQGEEAVRLARSAVEAEASGRPAPAIPGTGAFSDSAGAFVTLDTFPAGELRGLCRQTLLRLHPQALRRVQVDLRVRLALLKLSAAHQDLKIVNDLILAHHPLHQGQLGG